MTTAGELRAAWKKYWAERTHAIERSASLIPTHPSAPMFTNSGMMQFVSFFLGEDQPPFCPPRATTIQKCVRAGGKHNDLDAIGRSLRHLSFFEMLGNFSFGDYFKREAIVWAWEFVTEVLGIDGNRIWITVHISDDEAAQIWHEIVGIPQERIQKLDKDNFWEMGETGPCGPSSELFYDFGPDFGPDGGPENPAAETRYIEFWNLVFMQYFRDATGTLTPLVNKNVDTGAGLERIVALLRGSSSLYDCDSLGRVVAEVERISGRKLGGSEQDDVAIRLIADHARTMTFLIADGVVPSNEDRGYVLRRIIRRAVRFAYLLGVETRVTPVVSERVIDILGEEYPEIIENRDLIIRILDREETQFRKTLETGLGILENELSSMAPGAVLPGKTAFMLHDTYGFPLEVTSEIVTDRGCAVDTDGFARLMADQRSRARSARKKTSVDESQLIYQRILRDYGITEFVGRDDDTVKATVVAITSSGDNEEIFLDRTPFYAEQGGQVGDTGTLTRVVDDAVFSVVDTVNAIPGLHAHRIKAEESRNPLTVGDVVVATIDVSRRESIRRNHTATHLLHWALREVLGTHVKQQGSLVAPDRLRFDFSHFEPLTTDELRKVEDLANGEIERNGEVRNEETTQEEALARGAIAFFGEKYGERVRVVEAGTHSTELCGGTHVHALGEIGLVKIVSESSIGSNLRRIEAVTGHGVMALIRDTERLLGQTASELGVPAAQLASGAKKRIADLKAVQAENKRLHLKLEEITVTDLLTTVEGLFLVAQVDQVEPETLRRLAVKVRDRGQAGVVVLGSVTASGKPTVVAAVSDSVGVTACGLLAPIAKAIGGGCGKQRDIAVAGGRDASALTSALDAARVALAGMTLT